MDAWIKAHVTFHDFLHGFRAKRGCGTAIIEAKLLQQLAGLEQSTLFQAFLDLRKAYDALDRERALEIFEGYGMGPALCLILRNFWDQQMVVARQSGYLGDPFAADRGLTQGDVISPTLFNLVCNAVVRYWLSLVSDTGEDANTGGVGLKVVKRAGLSYADNGAISSRDGEWLQRALDVLAELFGRLNLKTNTDKTEVMVCHPGYIRTWHSAEAYAKGRERQRQHVECPKC
jgi:hypothetical protein